GFQPPSSHIRPRKTSAPAPSRGAKGALSVTLTHRETGSRDGAVEGAAVRGAAAPGGPWATMPRHAQSTDAVSSGGGIESPTRDVRRALSPPPSRKPFPIPAGRRYRTRRGPASAWGSGPWGRRVRGSGARLWQAGGRGAR